MIGLALAAVAAMSLQSSPVPGPSREFANRQVRLTDGDKRPHDYELSPAVKPSGQRPTDPSRSDGVQTHGGLQYAGVGVDGDTLMTLRRKSPEGLVGTRLNGRTNIVQPTAREKSYGLSSDERGEPRSESDEIGWNRHDPGQNRNASFTIYRWSVAALVAGAALDTASSWGRYELNPVLGRGEFGRRQVGIKVGLTAGALGAQWFLLRRFNRPKSRRALAVLNLLQAGALGVVAGRNWTR